MRSRVSSLADVLQFPRTKTGPARFAVGAMLAIASLTVVAGRQPNQQQPGSAGQPNYPPQPYPPQGYPPQQGYPPNYAQQGQPPAAQPSYGQQPGYGAYNEPPLPPPPKRIELEWSIRFQLLDL